MRRVEAVDRHVGGSAIERARGHVNPHFPGLAEVAHICRADDLHLGCGEAFDGERLAGLFFETPVGGIDRFEVERVVALDGRGDVVVLDVDGQQAEG